MCTYDAAYARGRAPSITAVPRLEAAPSSMPAGPSIMSPSIDFGAPDRDYGTLHGTEHGIQGGRASNHASSSQAPERPEARYNEASMANSPEPPQTDLQGHYIGPSSGVSFLLRVQKRLEQAISFSHPSSIFTFGDAPLQQSTLDSSFCMMLPRDDSQKLIDRYFDFAMPTYRFLHRPTIQEWFEEFCVTLGAMQDTSAAPAKIALLLMVFAHGSPSASAQTCSITDHHRKSVHA